MGKTNKKNKNIFISYFLPFGIRQICDILILVSAILMVVGVFVNETILLVGLIIFLLAISVMIIKHVLVLISKIDHRSPEYRSAFVDIFIAGTLFVIALFGLFYYFLR